MAKVILLLRISTTRQEIETQKNELVQLAKSDGYKENELIIIEGVGASAIKLNDIYLQEMEELYNVISSENISAVYAWEISRIGRNEEILMKFKNFLIDRKVQLVIKNPSLKLLNNDGSVNKGVELAFSLFATMSKQEMEIKKERFKRAKARNKEEGKYNGGPIKLGYRLNDFNYFVVDNEKADVVRTVFQWYLDGWSLLKIYNTLSDMGIYKSNKLFNTRGQQVRYVLQDEAYIGKNGYPQIVDEGIFQQVNEMISNRKKSHRSKNVFYCKGLIKDTETGLTLCAGMASLAYHLKTTQNCIALNINTMDTLALYCANQLLAWQLSNQAQTNNDEYTLKIKQNEELITLKQSQINELKSATDRAIEMNIMHPTHFTTEKMEAIINRNDNQIKSIEKTVVDLQTENTRMNNWLNGEKVFINQIKKEYSDEKKKEIIDSLIDRIEITKIGFRHYQIVVKDKIGLNIEYVFDYFPQGHRINVKQLFKDGRELDLTQKVANNKRFKRNRY